MKGKIVYSLIYTISKEVKKTKEEIVKPVKSSPNYEEYFPRFKILENAVVQEIKWRKITFDLKTFGETSLIIEAETDFDLKTTNSILGLKNTLFEECKKIAKKYEPSSFFEEYMFFIVKDFDNVDSYLEQNGMKIAELLKDEQAELAKKEVDDTLASSLRYGRDDITIIDWDGAFLLEKLGDYKDIVSILEVANIQLLNLRILDSKVQDEVSAFKDQSKTSRTYSFFSLHGHMRNIITTRVKNAIELGNIENSLKLYGDWYTAKLYDLASRKLYIERWKGDVEKKLDILRDMYEMVSTRVTEKYNILLEFIIVLLIVFEIVMAFVR